MKTITSKIGKTFFIISFYFSLFSASAQAPQKMSYQAVIRNASNTLISNANVRMRISVLQGTANGTAVYVETQTATTNANGLATVEIGAGTVVSGTFASIAWGTNAYFIKTETDPTGGTNYTISGTTQFLSVPYALYANNSGLSNSSWATTGNNIANNNTGNVGIGTGATVPSSILTVKKDEIGFTQEDNSGASQIGFYTNANAAFIQTHSNTDLSFATNNGLAQMSLQKLTGNLGIGQITPTEKLDVSGKTKTINLQVTNSAAVGKVLTSDAAGNATWQDQITPFIHLSAVGNNTQAISNTVTNIIKSWDVTEQTGGSNYNSTTGEYTIPITGYYSISAQIRFQNPNTLDGYGSNISIFVDGNAQQTGYSNYAISGQMCSTASVRLDRKLNAGQLVFILVNQSGAPNNYLTSYGSNFNINLLHK